ncbi:MAG: HPP family protein [Proteobacteria bacterium]|nr:HPP family protein [Pseudomonadota bacterium]
MRSAVTGSETPDKWSFAKMFPSSTLSLREKIRSALMAFVGVLLTGWVGSQIIDGGGLKTLLASMGASAVILFAMPHSPVAKPWPLIGGHFISATIGVLCAGWITQTWIATALAVSLSIFAMHLARCLHPPGGATAIIPVLGGESVKALGFEFLLTPLALNVSVLLLMSLLYQRLLSNKPMQQATQPGIQGTRPMERLGIQTEDLRAALAQMNEFVDVGERELNEIYNLAAARAFHREFGAITAAQVMTPVPLTVEFGTELEETWGLMQKHRIKALPVIDRGRHVIGIVTQSDFFRHARAEQFRSLGGKLRDLIRPTTTVTSDKPEVVGQIMTSPALTAGHAQQLGELARLLTERGIHQLPVVDENNKVVGLITQTDLIAALYRSMTTHFEKQGTP